MDNQYMDNQYMNDLYNYCCLRTDLKNENIKDITDEHSVKLFNEIVVDINNTYIGIMKKSANMGNNYAKLYQGEMPDKIVDNLQYHLSLFFKNFKILILNDNKSLLDILISDYDMYSIYIIWGDDLKKIDEDKSTNTENIENNTVEEDVDELKIDNLMMEYELIE